jgi:hypothetical protein
MSKGILLKRLMNTVYRTFYVSKDNLFEAHMATAYGTWYISNGSLLKLHMTTVYFLLIDWEMNLLFCWITSKSPSDPQVCLHSYQ